ncbi:MAG: hypothetical protein K9L59_16015 [Desulfobacterales bacterium]|nr:hypothetical protein [Desulfobacterales bacterium]
MSNKIALHDGIKDIPPLIFAGSSKNFKINQQRYCPAVSMLQSVTPAQAGVQRKCLWIPACAGMTKQGIGVKPAKVQP